MSKIKTIRCYQSVYFEKRMYDSFTIVEVKGRPDLKLNIVTIGKSLEVIEVKSEKDLVHIPLTNISGIYYFNHADAEREKVKAAELTAKASNAKNASKHKIPKPR